MSIDHVKNLLQSLRREVRRSDFTRNNENEGRPKRKSGIKKDAQYRRLKNHIWGLGIEHESMLFHLPNPSSFAGNRITDFIIFNGAVVVERMLNYNTRINRLERRFLEKYIDVFEQSGRRCNKKDVIESPLGHDSMVEHITGSPISQLKLVKKPIEYYVDSLLSKEFKLIEIFHADNTTENRMQKYGQIVQFPFGMSRYIKVPTNSTKLETKYKFKKKLFHDYTGSFHITMTLPFKPDISVNKFVEMHQNFANCCQWLEPLLLTAYFSCDQKAVGNAEKRVRGSFRVMMTGWGNIAGSDVRRLGEGIGRYGNIETYWRKGLDFVDLNKMKKYCKGMSPSVAREPGAISSLSSNFRTFGVNANGERKSGLGMIPPFGMEFRIFDSFDVGYLESLCTLLVYLAENSRKHKAKCYVYKNKDWIHAMQTIMKEGWRAKVTDGFVKELRKNLGLKIATKSRVAYDIMSEINVELYERNKGGDWSYLMLDQTSRTREQLPELPQINRRSWDMGFVIYMNRNPKVLKQFNKMIMGIPQRHISIAGFKKHFFKHFSKKKWIKNALDVMYFMQYERIIDLVDDKKLRIIGANHNHIMTHDDLNGIILAMFNTAFHEKFHKNLTKDEWEKQEMDFLIQYLFDIKNTEKYKQLTQLD